KPHVSPAITTAQFCSTGLEGEELVVRVKGGGRWVAYQGAEVKEVLLVDLFLIRRVAAPLGNELLWKHGRLCVRVWDAISAKELLASVLHLSRGSASALSLPALIP